MYVNVGRDVICERGGIEAVAILNYFFLYEYAIEY